MVYRWRDTAMLECRRVGHIVTDVNNHRDTAMLMCRCVGHIVTDVNNHRDTAMRQGDAILYHRGRCLRPTEMVDEAFLPEKSDEKPKNLQLQTLKGKTNRGKCVWDPGTSLSLSLVDDAAGSEKCSGHHVDVRNSAQSPPE